MQEIYKIENGYIFTRPKEHRTYKEVVIKHHDILVYGVDYDTLKDHLVFNYTDGYFHVKFLNEVPFIDSITKKPGVYPYNFNKEYEAVRHFDLFNGNQVCVNPEEFIGSSYLRYTFGLEFETSIGAVPENFCFRDGLIPLRDGSISGAEYSTVILKNNVGVSLLKQQLETLKKYTEFNKECALHIHFGGYPIQETYIYALYFVCRLLEGYLTTYTNRFVFHTGRYKKTGKDYCNPLQYFENFSEMYSSYAGVPYENSLFAPHPADVEHARKWNIAARYKWVNLVNMMFYEKPKTVEFRFLRPTYNFTKIYTWILVLNGILRYAELLASKVKSTIGDDYEHFIENNSYPTSLPEIINKVYPSEIANILQCRLIELRAISRMQNYNEDYIGQRIEFENQVMNFDFIKK